MSYRVFSAVSGGAVCGGQWRRYWNPKTVGEWLRSAYLFVTDRNDFRRNLIVNLGLFAGGIWLARNLNDIDLMASQPGL